MMLLFTQYYCRLVSQWGQEALLERINLKSRYDRYAKLANASQMIDQLGCQREYERIKRLHVQCEHIK